MEEGRPKGNKGWGPRLFPLDLQTVFPLSSSIAIRRVLFCLNDPNALILVIELQHVSRLLDVVCRFVEKRGVRERWSGWQVGSLVPQSCQRFCLSLGPRLEYPLLS